MVADTGKTLRTDTIKPVNMPEPVSIKESANGVPLIVKAKRQEKILAIEARWRIDDEWWRSEAISRLYFTVILASGQRMVLYKDLVQNTWFRQAL